MGAPPEDLTEPGAACCDLGVAAVISFHRGDTDAARGYLAAADPYARRLGRRPVGPLALARSLDHEQAGALPEARAALTDAFDGNEEIEEIEGLLADAVRLAAGTGDLSGAQALAGHADTLAAESKIPHRLANALYCRGLLDRDAARLLVAAERYGDASRPLLRAKALEAAAGYFVDADDRGQARAAFIAAVEVYTSLGAAADVARVQDVPRPRHPARAHAKHRRVQSGWDSLTRPRSRSPRRGRGIVQPEIAPAAAIAGPSPRTSRTSTRNSMSTHGLTWPESPAQHRAEVTRRASERRPLEPRRGARGSRGVRWRL